MRRRRPRTGSCGELVIGCPQPGNPFQVAIATLIDQALGVLDPDAKLKGLGRHPDACLLQVIKTGLDVINFGYTNVFGLGLASNALVLMLILELV